MLNFQAWSSVLRSGGLGDWLDTLEPLVAGRLADGTHGNLREWQEALADLPDADPQPLSIQDGAVTARLPAMTEAEGNALRDTLLRLRPWRKGPFRIGDVTIDAEWRSDLKWARLDKAISPLVDRRVLDVGSGNGYYALRMHLAGARLVVGIDPTLLYVMQFQAVAHFLADLPVLVLPIRLDDLPARSRAFDTAFSMGVLYHQRAPIDHLRLLRDALRPGGELVLETLILPGDEACSRTPSDRYARMRNVWHLPTVPELEIWLDRAGFIDVETGTACRTTTDEQRSTLWMPFESLVDALAEGDATETVEGWPAPLRVITVCRVPG